PAAEWRGGSQDGDAGVEAAGGVELVLDAAVQFGDRRVDRALRWRVLMMDDADTQLGHEAPGASEAPQLAGRQRPAPARRQLGWVVGRLQPARLRLGGDVVGIAFEQR